jgi:hypothetical protein
MFVVILPTWEGSRPWELLFKSPFTTHHELLEAGQHSYCEGAQHTRANRYRTACTASSVFYLQSKTATRCWRVGSDHLARLREAFAVKRASPSSPSHKVSSAQAPEAREALVAGRDELIRGDFASHEPAGAHKRTHKRKSKCLDIGTQVQPPPVSCSDRSQERGGTSAQPSEALHVWQKGREQHKRIKRQRSRCGSHTGKFASDDKASTVIARVLAAEGLGGCCPVKIAADASVAQEASALSGSPSRDAFAEFALSKSQRQKLMRGKSAKRRSASRKRELKHFT